MCQFFSAIVTKNKVIWDYDYDSHELLLKKAGLKDTGRNPEFVRVELLPQDNDIFNHDLNNWRLEIDQDYKPDWFCQDEAEIAVKKELVKVFKERFLNTSVVEKIDSGRWWLYGDVVVKSVYGNCVIEYASGNCVIEHVSGNCVIKNAYGNCVIDKLEGDVIVRYKENIIVAAGSNLKLKKFNKRLFQGKR